MSVSLRDVMMAVRYGDAALVGESAGYIVLGAADCAMDRLSGPTLDSVSVTLDGALLLDGAAAREEEVERSLRALLAQLLTQVRSACPNLERVAQRPDPRGVAGLVTELEAALVPVNRKAARRSLARLVRETKKSAAQERHFAAVESVEPPQVAYEPIPSEPAPVVEIAPPVAAPALVPSPVVERLAMAFTSAPLAPTPPPSLTDQIVRGEHAEQIVEARPSRLPTVRAPHPQMLMSLAREYRAQTPLEAAAVRPSFSYEEPSSFHEDDGLDEEPTRVFVGVREMNGQAAVLEQPAPARVALPPRRRPPVVARTRRVIPDDEPLIALSEEAPQRRPSDIGELLDRMSSRPQPADELYVGLKTLSRVDLSPVAPPVGSSWMGDDSRD